MATTRNQRIDKARKRLEKEAKNLRAVLEYRPEFRAMQTELATANSLSESLAIAEEHFPGVPFFFDQDGELRIDALLRSPIRFLSRRNLLDIPFIQSLVEQLPKGEREEMKVAAAEAGKQYTVYVDEIPDAESEVHYFACAINIEASKNDVLAQLDQILKPLSESRPSGKKRITRRNPGATQRLLDDYQKILLVEETLKSKGEKVTTAKLADYFSWNDYPDRFLSSQGITETKRRAIELLKEMDPFPDRDG